MQQIIAPCGLIIFTKFRPKFPSLDSDYRVDPGIEVVRPAEDLRANYVFFDLVCTSGESLLNDETQEVTGRVAFGEYGASEDFFELFLNQRAGRGLADLRTRCIHVKYDRPRPRAITSLNTARISLIPLRNLL